HLLRGREDLEGDLEGAVPAADGDPPFVLELLALPDSVLDALAFQFRLAGHVEPLRLEQAHPHREQDRPRLEGVPLAGADAEARRLTFDVDDLLGAQLGPALAGMEDEQLRELPAFDRDVARVVVDRLRRIEPFELSSDRLRLQDQGGELPGAGVHPDTFKFVVLATGLRRRDVAWPSSKNLFVDCTRAAPRKRIRTSTWPS